jgi:hypothetical protein
MGCSSPSFHHPIPPPNSTLSTDLIVSHALTLQKHKAHLSTLHSKVMATQVQAAVKFEREHLATIRDFDFKSGDLVLVCNTAIEKSLNRKMCADKHAYALSGYFRILFLIFSIFQLSTRRTARYITFPLARLVLHYCFCRRSKNIPPETRGPEHRRNMAEVSSRFPSQWAPTTLIQRVYFPPPPSVKYNRRIWIAHLQRWDVQVALNAIILLFQRTFLA